MGIRRENNSFGWRTYGEKTVMEEWTINLSLDGFREMELEFTFWKERINNEVKQGNAGKTPGKRICLIFIGTCGIRAEAGKVG